MSAQAKHIADARRVLARALVNAGKVLGINQQTLGRVIGKDRTAFTRGIDPDSKSGELALLLVRVYRSLYALMGGNEQDMRHWMNTEIHGTGGIPRNQILSVTGLARVLAYLDAMRAKV